MANKKLILNNLVKNGGKGSGNFAPGQGRGVGKPGSGSLSHADTVSVYRKKMNADYERESKSVRQAESKKYETQSKLNETLALKKDTNEFGIKVELESAAKNKLLSKLYSSNVNDDQLKSLESRISIKFFNGKLVPEIKSEDIYSLKNREEMSKLVNEFKEQAQKIADSYNKKVEKRLKELK